MRVLLLAAMVSLAACGGGDGDGGGDPAESAGLEGVWQGVCEQSELASYRHELNIDDNTILVSKHYWPGSSDCSGAAEQDELGSYSYSIGEEMVTDSGVNARELDIQFTETSNQAFDIFMIDRGDTLYFGDPETGDQNTLVTRPTDLDLDQPYSRSL